MGSRAVRLPVVRHFLNKQWWHDYSVGIAVVVTIAVLGLIAAVLRATWGWPEPGAVAIGLLCLVGAVAVYALLVPPSSVLSEPEFESALREVLSTRTFRTGPPVPIEPEGATADDEMVEGEGVEVSVKTLRVPLSWRTFDKEVVGSVVLTGYPVLIEIRVVSRRVFDEVMLLVRGANVRAAGERFKGSSKIEGDPVFGPVESGRSVKRTLGAMSRDGSNSQFFLVSVASRYETLEFDWILELPDGTRLASDTFRQLPPYS